ncbi:ABC transporter ATP-binding protein [Brachybacterium paraconglomeratum]|uniref:ABC transporter ATP-binding protein n=1 Tax=Brachybacterium paraconglomeratum TaxID=173362 RepID=UPI0022E0CBEF|nr:ABC transporter ATP-binding protein [Brachybacterium paraconglomeratum]
MSLVLRAAVAERDVELYLEVGHGETLAVVGPNGAGKSTALSLISGDLRPSSGSVSLDGRILADERTWAPPHHRRVTTLSQDPVLFPHLTALGNVMFPLRAQGVPRREARRRAEVHLAQMGLADLAARRPAQLSGGQAQRVAIARALAADPRLLLLDEPMAALDVDVAPALREQLRGFLANRTAIVVTHDVLDALSLADRVVVLEQGREVDAGPTTEVLARPRSAFAARLAGLNLVAGRWDGHRIELEGGGRLSADSPLGPGTAVLAAFRPAAVRLAEQGLPRTVRSLTPHGDLVRVRTEDLAADLCPQDAAARHLAPGTAVHLAVAPEDVTTYLA